ncbi:hypothetical protein M407DRAFT_24236 [Tulasnella calospora MUT 4182]|uniref:Uncharacterized protein n=1 Tax=Tulasnella calospora MUT 4182 TaxID=1051891 RepID=A0A0C3QI98_9AGAM|nr:hypothetical protein M407DRAFT_24236 [Tulasnella calospora MUT 4182]
MSVALRLYLHQDDPEGSKAAPGIIEEIMEGGGAGMSLTFYLAPSPPAAAYKCLRKVVSRIEDAQCVILSEPNEKNAIKLQRLLASETRHIPVLRFDWVGACLKAGYMFGPKANPEWTAFVSNIVTTLKTSLTMNQRTQKKRYRYSQNTRVLWLSDSDERDDNNSLEQSNSRPRAQKHNRSRKVHIQTAAKILSAISEDMARYGIEDLIRLVRELANTDPQNYAAIFKKLAATNNAAGKGMPSTLRGSSFAETRIYSRFVSKNFAKETSLDNILLRESTNAPGPIKIDVPDSPLSSVPPATELGER